MFKYVNNNFIAVFGLSNVATPNDGLANGFSKEYITVLYTNQSDYNDEGTGTKFSYTLVSNLKLLKWKKTNAKKMLEI